MPGTTRPDANLAGRARRVLLKRSSERVRRSGERLHFLKLAQLCRRLLMRYQRNDSWKDCQNRYLPRPCPVPSLWRSMLHLMSYLFRLSSSNSSLSLCSSIRTDTYGFTIGFVSEVARVPPYLTGHSVFRSPTTNSPRNSRLQERG